ncbi:MAG: alpha/beta hydrolase fold domain-containing protein, partial [Planctomycetes bacterium]|nr:alpha/beta hydrolase fold domain-containing protein [Planctomycetota bacterium]
MLRTLIYSLALLFAADAFAAEPAKPAPPKRIGWGNFPPDNQAKLLLWPEGAPGALGKEEADTPWLWLYPAPADKANGAAVVVCPGGGYGGLAIGHEGNDVAKWWNSLGVSAYVLKYRVAPYKHPVPLGDVQRAIRLVRSKADEWKLDPKRIGVMGFSAGGHLASSLATHFDDGQTDSKDPIDATGCRPDFADGTPSLIVYPSDREAYGRLTRLLTAGQMRSEKGECELHWEDFLAHAEGQLTLVVPPERLDEAFEGDLRRITREVPDVWLAASRRYGPRDLHRLSRLAALSERCGAPMVATNDVLYHGPERRALQDVLTCIRETCSIH